MYLYCKYNVTKYVLWCESLISQVLESKSHCAFVRFEELYVYDLHWFFVTVRLCLVYIFLFFFSEIQLQMSSFVKRKHWNMTLNNGKFASGMSLWVTIRARQRDQSARKLWQSATGNAKCRQREQNRTPLVLRERRIIIKPRPSWIYLSRWGVLLIFLVQIYEWIECILDVAHVYGASRL